LVILCSSNNEQGYLNAWPENLCHSPRDVRPVADADESGVHLGVDVHRMFKVLFRDLISLEICVRDRDHTPVVFEWD
jgi:hypothetical protein